MESALVIKPFSPHTLSIGAGSSLESNPPISMKMFHHRSKLIRLKSYVSIYSGTSIWFLTMLKTVSTSCVCFICFLVVFLLTRAQGSTECYRSACMCLSFSESINNEINKHVSPSAHTEAMSVCDTCEEGFFAFLSLK